MTKLLIRRLISSAAHGLRLTHLASDSWRIVLYHRIIDPESCTIPLQSGMYVRPSTFERHLQYYAKHCHVMPLSALLQHLLSGDTLPHRTIAITFDDGWRDNYENAYPLLKFYAVPATIFLATGFISSSRPFWTETAGSLVKRLQSPLDPLPPLAGSALSATSAIAFLDLLGSLRALPPPDAVDRLVAFIASLPLSERSSLLDALAEQVHPQPSDAFLTWNQVREMQESGVTFASHTHSHTVLQSLPYEQVTAELQLSFRCFDSHNIPALPIFCYPQGAYDSLSHSALKSFGITAAVAATNRSSLTHTPPLLGRQGLHDDTTLTESMLAWRLWFGW